MINDDWKDFEELVEMIERTSGATQYLNIQRNKFATDKASTSKRQIDLLLSYDDGHRNYKMLIECKKYKRPVGIEKIESLVIKIRDTNCDMGMIVSSSKFTKGALEKAKNHNIRCLSLVEAKNLDWIKNPNVSVVTNRWISPPNVRIGIAENLTITNYKLFMRNKDDPQEQDIEISNPDILTNFTKNLFHQANTDPAFEACDLTIRIQNKEDFYIIVNEKKYEIEYVEVEYKYISEETLNILNLFIYQDEIEHVEKIQLGKATLNMDGKRVSLIIKRSKDRMDLSFHAEE